MRRVSHVFAVLLSLALLSACSRPNSEKYSAHESSKKRKEILSACMKEFFRHEKEDPVKGSFIVKRLSDEERRNLSADQTEELDQDLIAFNLNGNGFQPGEEFDFYIVNMKTHIGTMGRVLADAKGKLAWDINNERKSGFVLVTSSYLKGEPLFAVLSSKDGKNIARCMIPIPIEYKWADGAKFYMVMIGDTLEDFILVADGFFPEEELNITSKSCGQTMVNNVRTSKEGRFITFMRVGVVNHKGGVGELSIVRSGNSEKGIVEYLWGNKTQDPKVLPSKTPPKNCMKKNEIFNT